MATHGTIWLTNTEEPDKHVFLQTPHDGHRIDAIAMLCELPKFIAEQQWWALNIANYENPLIREKVLRFAQRNGNFANLYLLGVAHAIVSRFFDRWQIIPPEFEEYLADYDRNPEYHLKVELNPILWEEGEEKQTDNGLLIYENFDEFKDSSAYWMDEMPPLGEWVEAVNEKLTPDARIVPNWTNEDGSKTGIFVPYFERIVDETLARAIQIQADLRDDNAYL